MPARRMNSTYRTPQAACRRVLAAREELRTETEERSAEAEPMRRWPHPIPTSGACSACSSCACCADEGELALSLTQVLEKLQYQNQVLTDLLAAVNSLTATVLCLKGPDSSAED